MMAEGRTAPFRGMSAFMVVWFGQMISFLGTGMTRFAVLLWIWEQTGQATSIALLNFAGFLPVVLFSPIAGALVDRSNRKLMVMIGDLGAGLATFAVLLVSLTGDLQIWHLYAGAFVAGMFESFQFPAYSAAITMMVEEKHYARASAMLGLAEAASGIAAPIAAAALYPFIGLTGIFLIDVFSFVFAVSVVTLTHIPQPPVSAEGRAQNGSFWQDVLFGFRYILRRPSLFSLQLVFLCGNLLAGISLTLLSPMILSRTGNNELILASVATTMAISGVIGGVGMSVWGGFQRRINGVLGGWLLSGLCGSIILGLGQVQIVWMIGGVGMSFFIPLVNASNQAIWQSRVAPDLQGRVFSVRRLIAQITSPIGTLLAGVLADRVFEPAMQPDGALAPLLGPLFGTGSGAGMGVIVTITGLLTVMIALAAYAIPTIRNVETIIPPNALPALEAAA